MLLFTPRPFMPFWKIDKIYSWERSPISGLCRSSPPKSHPTVLLLAHPCLRGGGWGCLLPAWGRTVCSGLFWFVFCVYTHFYICTRGSTYTDMAMDFPALTLPPTCRLTPLSTLLPPQQYERGCLVAQCPPLSTPWSCFWLLKNASMAKCIHVPYSCRVENFEWRCFGSVLLPRQATS